MLAIMAATMQFGRLVPPNPVISRPELIAIDGPVVISFSCHNLNVVFGL
tara:strand:- start:12126 stop:12272 length:147 start_codon:yes stop_codon:yes gene_type:complete